MIGYPLDPYLRFLEFLRHLYIITSLNPLEGRGGSLWGTENTSFLGVSDISGSLESRTPLYPLDTPNSIGGTLWNFQINRGDPMEFCFLPIFDLEPPHP